MRNNFINLLALMSIQASNALLPIIAFPFILKIVGTNYFSKIATSESIILIALTFVLYSFEVNGAAKLVYLDLSKDIERISKIFISIIYIRLLIIIILIILFCVLIVVLSSDWMLLILSWMLLPLGHILQSFWFFQALERNLLPAIFVVTSRLLCLIVLYLMVKLPCDYYLVPVIIGMSYVLSGALSVIYAFAKLKIRFYRISINELKTLIYEGKDIFVGNLSVTLFRGSNTIILNLVSNDSAVSIYAISEKIIKCIQAVMRPLNQLFFPKLISALGNKKLSDKEVLRIVSKYTIPQVALLFIIICLSSLIYIILKSQNLYINLNNEHQIATLLMLMIISVFFGIANFTFGTAGLNHLDQRAYYAKSIFKTGLTSMLLCSLLSHYFFAAGAAISYSLGEILLFLLVFKKYYIERNDSCRETAYV